MSKTRILPYQSDHRDAVVRLSLRAWEPVFDSLRRVMVAEVYDAFFPDWRVTQRKAVEEACASDEMHVWVAVEGDAVAGFVALRYHQEDRLGEVYMIAVDPDYQRRGIARALMEFAQQQMKEAGMSVAMVETGGDPGHAPARATYENLGFDLLPVARYFKKL